jgi:hypothetical protein
MPAAPQEVSLPHIAVQVSTIDVLWQSVMELCSHFIWKFIYCSLRHLRCWRCWLWNVSFYAWHRVVWYNFTKVSRKLLPPSSVCNSDDGDSIALAILEVFTRLHGNSPVTCVAVCVIQSLCSWSCLPESCWFGRYVRLQVLPCTPKAVAFLQKVCLTVDFPALRL